MHIHPDYATARQDAGFSWSVAGTQGALRELTGVPIRDFNLEPEACIEAYHRGRPLLREMFGEDVRLPPVSTPHISYGHPNTLGSELVFPHDGEVAVRPLFDSLEAGIEALRQPVDFLSQGMAPFYLDFREKLRQAFPNESVGFAFGYEGPVTTAYELCGVDFYLAVMDAPEAAIEFLAAVVDSVVDYHRVLCKADGREPVNSDGAGMCDDCASFIPPHMWPQLVLPAWERHFRGLTTGRRSAHVENLTADHLPYLEEIGLSFFDPSISPWLCPPIIATACRVPFLWRLGSFHYPSMSVQDVADFVYLSAADGANSAVTYIAEGMCNQETVDKVHAFIEAGKVCRQHIQDGGQRRELRDRVSSEGREKLWDGWCGYQAKGT